jgi:hypothetical protein
MYLHFSSRWCRRWLRVEPPSITRPYLVIVAVAVALICLAPVTAFAEQAGPAAPAEATALTRRTLLPLVRGASGANTGTTYVAIPVLAPPTDRPAAQHADLNLGMRGYSLTSEPLTLISYGGDTDPSAPQIPGIFSDHRTPRFTSAYRVYQWNWGCGPDGCRGDLIASPQVTLLGMETRPGEHLATPSRGPEIYPGGFIVLVLYADENRITLKYTREDNVVTGYTVHLENLSVDQNLLSLYRDKNAAGRGQLPGLKNGQPLGIASGDEVLVAIRDNGNFMDTRSRKDWWQGR